MALLGRLDPGKTRLTGRFLRCETIFILEGLAETVRFCGVKMASQGRKKEAPMGRMLTAKTGARDTKGEAKVAKWNSGS